MYSIIFTGKEFDLHGRPLPRFPFVIQKYSMDNEALVESARDINRYLIYLGSTMALDIEKTVLPIARHIVLVLNYLDQQKCPIFFVTEKRLVFFRNKLVIDGKLNNESINRVLNRFCRFLWWAENKGICKHVIGVNDAGKSNIRYKISVEPSKGYQKFKLQFTLPKVGTSGMIKAPVAAWDHAYNTVLNAGDAPITLRDEMFIRLFREAKLRRVEAVNLLASEFEDILGSGEKYRVVQLYKTKKKATRDVKIEKPLYEDIQDYIATSRKELVKSKPFSDALLPSARTGSFMHSNSINAILKRYDSRLTPQQGRSIGLTERFVDLIELGFGKEECLLIVAEEAGHSHKSEGETLIKHYLQAEIIVKKGNIPSRGAMCSEISKLRMENARLLAELDKTEEVCIVK